MFILALDSIIGQPSTTLLRENVSAGALEVKQSVIKGPIMWITIDGAGASLHCLAGELKGTTLADLGKGARFIAALQAR